MQPNGSVKPYSYNKQFRRINRIQKTKVRMRQFMLLIKISLAILEYSSYIITFFLLMAIRVIPEYQVSSYNPLEWLTNVQVFGHYMLLLLMILVIHTFTLIQENLFSGKADRSLMDECVFVTRSIIYAFLISVGLTFLLKTTLLYSRLTLVVFIIIMLIEAILWRTIRTLVIRKLSSRGMIASRVLIVGAGKVGMEIEAEIINSRKRKDHIVGFLDDYKVSDNIIGRTSDLELIMEQQIVDIVYITIPSERRIIESILHSVYKYNIDIRIIPEMFDRMSTVFTFRNDLDYPCMQIVKTPLRGINIVLKRLSDIAGSTMLLVVLSPVFLMISLLIKLDSKGPVLFYQQRIGKNGVPFRMLKFRSMHQEAESMKQELENMNESNGPAFKMRNDPRVTSLGRLLRKYSLDELPQLMNVWCGEMSLIGPRPPLPKEVEQYTNYHWRRMDVLPGMTGLWQVSGRSDLDFEQWVDLDIYYIERWSIGLEMKILFKTIPVVLKGAGAY